MTEAEKLQKIIDGPVYLLEGNDGMVYGNSQALAKEVQELRKGCRGIYKSLDLFISISKTEWTYANASELILIGQIRAAAYRLSGDTVADIEN